MVESEATISVLGQIGGDVSIVQQLRKHRGKSHRGKDPLGPHNTYYVVFDFALLLGSIIE